MALAPLGFTVDTGPIAKAVADLDKITAATAKAEAGTKSITAPAIAAASATKQLGAASSQAAVQMTLATNAVKANNAALQISAQSAAMAQMQMRNLAFQTQDVFTMLLAGQNPVMLLVQQLPQITMYGGKLTGLMGALKSTVTGLISPLGLLTTGFVLAGSAAISYFSGADREAEKAADELGKQQDLISRVADEWGNALPAVKAYSEELQRAAKAKEAQEATAKAITAEFDKAEKALRSFVEAAGPLNLDQVFGPAAEEAGKLFRALDDLKAASQDFREEQKRGGDVGDEYRRIQQAISKLLDDDVVPSTSTLRDEVEKLAGAYAQVAKNAASAAGAAAVVSRGGRVGQMTLDEAQETYDFQRQLMMRMNPEAFADIFDPPKKRTRRPRKSEAEREAERTKEAYADMIRSSQQFIASQELEAQALYMTEEAANRLRYEQELLNQAANDNIKLTPAMTAELKSYAEQMAAAEAETQRLQESLDFAKDITRGFFEDIRGGLEQGKSLWESFGNAALNVLDKITDKLLNDVIDALFQVNKAGSGFGGGGGLLGMIGGLFGASMFPGGMGFATPGYVGTYHTGGIVGQSTAMRLADSSLFINAPRYHNGGIAGDEVPAILRRGEIVSRDMNHLRQQAGNQNGGQRVQIDVGVYVSDDGTLGAIARQAGQEGGAEAADVRVRVFSQNELPDRLNQINAQPRRRGAA